MGFCSYLRYAHAERKNNWRWNEEIHCISKLELGEREIFKNKNITVQNMSRKVKIKGVISNTSPIYIFLEW